MLQKRKPTNSEKMKANLYFQQAIILYEEDLSEKAEQLINLAVSLNPSRIDYWQYFVRIGFQNKSWRAALLGITKLAKLKNYGQELIVFLKASVLLDLDFPKRAYHILNKQCVMALTLQMRHNINITKARCLIRFGKFNQIPELLESVPRDHYRYYACEFYKGYSFFYLGLFREAILHFNNAGFDEQFRKNTELLFLKGNSHYNIKQYDRAIISYEELLLLDSSYIEVEYMLNIIRLRESKNITPTEIITH